MSQKLGDIRLNDKWYRIDHRSYRNITTSDFSPRASVAGNSVMHSELTVYQPLLQTDWRHGFGFHWYTDSMGYSRTEGNIDTRHEGIVMLYTSAVESDTDNNVKYGFCVWNGAIWAWGAAGLRKFSGGTWSTVYSTGPVNFALPAGDYLFYCPDGARIRSVSTDDTHADTGVNSNAVDYKWLTIHSGFIYAGKDSRNQVYRSSSSDLSDLHGDPTDPDVIYAGFDNSNTLGAIVYAGNLYVAKANGLWQVGEDKIARRILDFSSEASDANFRSMIEFNGYLLFAIRDKLYQWNGARLSDITPPHIADVFPYSTYGRFANFVSANRYFYCTARTNETTYGEDLLCFDGVGWHKLARLVSNGSDEVTAMTYDSMNNYLWYHRQSSLNATYYIPLQNYSDYPYSAFPTTGTHQLYTSRWDMGFRWVYKSTTSLVIEASNLNSDRYLSIYYSIDGNAFTKWQDVITSGTTKLTMPAGDQSKEFHYIQLMVQFVTNDPTQSPILEGMTLRFLMRPETVLGWSFNVPIKIGMNKGISVEDRDAVTILNDLQAARDSINPIEFEDIYGIKHIVYVTSKEVRTVEWNKDVGGTNEDIESICAINLVEAK